MSLRDQLLASGLVSKKRAKKVDRDARSVRKQAKGNKKKKRVLEDEARGLAARALDETKAKRDADRTAHREIRDRHEALLRVRQILQGNAIRNRGPVPYFHRALRGEGLPHLQISVPMAEQLRRGEVAVAALDHGTRVDYLLLSKQAAERLFKLAPQVLVAWHRDPDGLSDPASQLHARDWEADLCARKRRTSL